MAKKIVFVRKLSNPLVERVLEHATGWEVVQGKDSSVWLPHLSTAEIVGGWNSEVETAFMSGKMPALRWIQNWGAGVDTLPLAEFERQGVILTDSSGVHPNPISETVFAMMLAFTRKLHVYVRNQTVKKWHHAGVQLELHGKTLGVLGVGAIGSECARLAKAFGMKTLGFRRTGEPHPAIDQMHGSLRPLLAEADYVVNTLPLTNETRHLMGRDEFAAMKPSAFYVNIGRGGTTDTQALIEALQTGRIAGAGLDVFEEEPLPLDSPLWEMENVIITPHSSGSTEHYDERVIDIFVANLKAYVRGDIPPVNRVDLKLQY